MKFLCLISAEKVMEDLPATDAESHFQEYAQFTNWLKTKGHFVGANRLKPASTATTVRVRDGKTILTDGPFAETKEQIGGYYLINAKDLDEAIKIAARIPGAQRGSVEVRAIADDAQTLALGLE
jgi:hypothetical protein